MGLEHIRQLKEQALLPKPKKVYTIPKKSSKKIEQEKNQTTVIVKPKKAGWFDKDKAALEDTVNVKDDLQQWFEDRRLEMGVYCSECGKPTFKYNDKQYKWSICHLLPKSIFKSVATHKDNCIFLCWLHHQEFDSGWGNAKKMFIWEEVKCKVQSFLPQVTEKHKILEHFK